MTIIIPSRSSSGGTYSSIGDVDSLSVLSSDSTLRSDNHFSLNSYSPLLKGTTCGYGYGYDHTTAPVDSYSLLVLDKSLPDVPGHANTEHDPYSEAMSSTGLRPHSNFSRPLTRRPHARSRSPNHRLRVPLQSQGQQHLINVLGPDNVPQTTELDTIPCAGITIPNGPFAGLLAWRLVVRLPNLPNAKHRGSTFVNPRMAPMSQINTVERKKARRMSWNALQAYTPPKLPSPLSAPFDYNRTMSESYYPYPSFLGAPSIHSHAFSASALSLPTGAPAGRSPSPMFPSSPMRDNLEGGKMRFSDEKVGYVDDFVPQPLPAYRSVLEHPTRIAPSLARSAPTLSISTLGEDCFPEAVTTNFIFDTSLSYNQVSRETLEALGYSKSFVDSLESAPSRLPAGSTSLDEDEKPTVSLRIQSLPTMITFQLAPRGESGRLGVKFLQESGVSLCLGEGGRGGIFWVDPTSTTKFLLKDVPRTVPLPKLSLQARVRALFGLTL